MDDLRPLAPGLVEVIGRKKVFLNALFNGITLGGLYFLVASGFTLIFGLMRNVNLAHGSLYLLGGYIGYEISDATGLWLLSFVVAFIAVALVGIAQVTIFRWMEGQDSRQTLVTLDMIVMADLMLWIRAGLLPSCSPTGSGAVETPLISSISRRTGDPIYLKYPWSGW